MVVRGGRAVGVRTRDGEPFAARHAVVADVAAPHLYGGLVSAGDLPDRTLRAMRSFRMGPGTVKVDWALDGPIPWASRAGVRAGHLPRRRLGGADERRAEPGGLAATSPPRRSCWPGR